MSLTIMTYLKAPVSQIKSLLHSNDGNIFNVLSHLRFLIFFRKYFETLTKCSNQETVLKFYLTSLFMKSFLLLFCVILLLNILSSVFIQENWKYFPIVENKCPLTAWKLSRTYSITGKVTSCRRFLLVKLLFTGLVKKFPIIIHVQECLFQRNMLTFDISQ